MDRRQVDRRGTVGPSRRETLRMVGGLVAATSVAGCASQRRYEFRAKPVGLPANVRRSLGLAETLREPVTVERTRTVGGVEVHATVKSHVAAYAPATGSASREEPEDGNDSTGSVGFGVISTPPAEVMGRSFNPLARTSLANLLTSTDGTDFLRRTGLDRVGHDRESVRWERGPAFLDGVAGECLGDPTTLESYAGLLAGTPRSVGFVHITRTRARSVVVPALVHGRDVSDEDRTYVGPDGYVSRTGFEWAHERFARASENLVYSGDRS